MAKGIPGSIHLGVRISPFRSSREHQNEAYPGRWEQPNGLAYLFSTSPIYTSQRRRHGARRKIPARVVVAARILESARVPMFSSKLHKTTSFGVYMTG
jgi:hypothetical protein